MVKLYVNPKKKLGHINPELYGHFSEHLGRCIYEGIYVGEDSKIPNLNGMRKDVVAALKEIRVPVLRWPGGCFADEYHWRDGVGPRNTRKKMINTHWGGVIEDNSFGTHEFLEFCRQLGCKTYINGNLGSGTVREMSEWVEYMTYDGVSPMADLRAANGHKEPWKVDYFAVGNENWGCGGNMTPEYYGNEYRRYQTFIRNYDHKNPIYKIACGANTDDYEWTGGVLKATHRHAPAWLHGFMNGLSLHYYTIPNTWENKGSATVFDEKLWYRTLKKALHMETLIKRHGAVMDEFDPDKKIGMIVDEWGTWFDVEPGTNPGFLYQQNTMRDALVAGISLNIFNKNCDRVKMANIAQMVNVLQSVILTRGEKMLLTPTYHVFHMYQYHQDSELLDSFLETEAVGPEDDYTVPALQESVSMSGDGRVHVTLNNLSVTDSYEIDAVFTEAAVKSVKGTLLSNEMDAHNTFEEPDKVKPAQFTKCAVTDKGIAFTIPACSVLQLELELLQEII
jgi:alpha-N-arabinofuranosidase